MKSTGFLFLVGCLIPATVCADDVEDCVKLLRAAPVWAKIVGMDAPGAELTRLDASVRAVCRFPSATIEKSLRIYLREAPEDGADISFRLDNAAILCFKLLDLQSSHPYAHYFVEEKFPALSIKMPSLLDSVNRSRVEWKAEAERFLANFEKLEREHGRRDRDSPKKS